MLWQKIPEENRTSLSVKEFAAWKKQTDVFQQLGTFTGTGFTISGRGEPELVLGHMVTPSFFQILGVAPMLGRTFLERREKPGRNHEVILSYALWRQKFGGRAGLPDEPIVMNAEPYAVIGVMPESFDFPNSEAKLWVPADLDAPLLPNIPTRISCASSDGQARYFARDGCKQKWTFSASVWMTRRIKPSDAISL